MLVSATRGFRATSTSRTLLSTSAPRLASLQSRSHLTYLRGPHAPGPLSTSRPPTLASRTLASFVGPSGTIPEPNALQVTDPLLIYRAKVARGELEEDEEQLRALVELRRINRTLRDYVPPAHLLGILHHDTQSASSAALASAIDSRLRPGAKEFRDEPSAKPSGENIGELVRWLSESEGLAELGTPKGLLITGTPGTGKSMVMDIFFDSLPTKYKFRRHYHHLLLDLYKIIWEEAERRRLAVRQGTPRATATPEIGTGAIWQRDPGAPKSASAWRRALRGMPFFRPDSLADGNSEQLQYIPGPDGDVVKTTLPLHAAAHLFLNHGHILLFDEIQLVDVASAGLLRRTLEAYWRLGGVVIGTSNRIPKDLYASNVQRGQLTQFLEILQERCPNHEMRRSRDFRREPFYRQEWLERNQEADSEHPTAEASEPTPTQPQTSYFLRNEADKYDSLVSSIIAGRTSTPTTLNVYGRRLLVPRSIPANETHPSVCRFHFSELCDSPLGPADYLTLASTYHTFILEGVPQMTLMQKNQARRMITLLDAVYEAGCRLVVLADAGPDDLFFPDAEGAARHAARGPAAGPGDVRPELQYTAHEDVVDMSTKGGRSPFLTPPPGQGYPEEEELARHKAGQRVDFSADEFTSESLIMAETLSEAMQDTEEGFRPNISAYSSDRPSRSPSSLPKDDKVGFKHLAIFSGEDERFSYQRAVSRLFEMSHPDWMRRKGWRPFLGGEMQAWAGTKKVEEAVGKVVVANELNEAQRHLDRAAEAAVKLSSSSAGASADSPARFVDPSGDFAEEASYETASFPGRREAQTKLEREMEQWSAKQQQAAQEQQGKNKYEAPDFSPGPIGKKRNRDQGPPVLSEAHVWGVREDWGKKAGAWGRGSSIFADDTPSNGDKSAHPTKPLRRPSPSSSSSGGGSKRKFSTTSLRSAQTLNHYTTLQIPRSATQAQIKAQFYKLSKELHPDVNPSEDAKKRFQEVSEAYATLGTPANRKSYDRASQPSAGGGGYGDNVGGGGYHYNAEDNANRRARATYAWDYQRRRKAQETSSQSQRAHSSIFNRAETMGAGSGDTAFETLAAQQRAREERNRARQAGSDAWSMEDKAYQNDVSNPFVRFGQVVVMLYLVYKAGTMFVGGERRENRAGRRT
ncbi:ATPase, AFG1-like protein [Kalmanozyma brasiliensis GHG001]|uniref:J domain-containing protein n=1 Tax=Kalmanozyma brasiliensis (strain GHG001) TaxID=1365824 RepID=V5EQY8_KALBG|nr:ATPase, AFG1-like protein [Kalmanozyma brasiliensis GHG001]EST07530.1 ATPase, AFG1-like protein [Kalmanozyma brasiliensis GHG001]